MPSTLLTTARAGARNSLAPVVGGLVIALFATAIASGPARWALAVFGGLSLLVPLVMVKNTRLYGLGLYLLLIMVETDKGKNLTKEVVDAGKLIDNLGLAPLNAVQIIIRPSDIVLLCLLVGWLTSILMKKETFRFSRLYYIPIAYLGWAALSSAAKAPYPYLSLAEWLPEARAFIVFVYIANVVRTRDVVRDLRRFLMILLLVEAAVTLAGLRWEWARDLLSFLSESSTGSIDQLPLVYERSLGGRRAVGTFGNYAVTAMYLHFLLPLALTRLFLYLGSRKAWTYFLLLSAGLTGLWFTYSRAGLLGAVAGLAVCTYLCRRRGIIGNGVTFVLVYAALVTLLGVSPLIKDYLETRPSTLPDRFPIMQKAVQLIEENPIMGVGLNNSTAVKRERFIDTVADEGLQPIHNHYLVVLTETGLVGFILFYGFFIIVGRLALVQTKSPSREVSLFAISVLSTYTAFSVQLLADTMFSHVPYGLLWFWAGLTLAFQRMAPPAPKGQA